jgi:hypothetical protein
MTVRAKFTCGRVEDYGQSKKVYLSPVYEGSLGESEENRRFTKATPSGEMWMTVDNPAAALQFKPGRTYYLTFEEAPADQWNGWAYDAPGA